MKPRCWWSGMSTNCPQCRPRPGIGRHHYFGCRACGAVSIGVGLGPLIGIQKSGRRLTLSNRTVQQPISEATLKLAWKDYGKLSAETAQRTLRFWQVHNKLEK